MPKLGPYFGDWYGVNETVYMPFFVLSFTKQNCEQKSTRVNSIARKRALFLLVNTDNDIVGFASTLDFTSKEREVFLYVDNNIVRRVKQSILLTKA